VNDPNYNGTTNKIAYVGTDGGIFGTQDILANLQPSWSSLNHTLGITQFYAGCGTASSGTIIGGTQDNGLDRYLGNPEGWMMTSPFGDAATCGCDQTDARYFYTEFPGLYMKRSADGASTWQEIPGTGNCVLGDAGNANWVAPFILDPNNPNRIFAGGRRLWRADNVKVNDPTQVCWLPIKPSPTPSTNYISAVAVAPGNSDTVWVGHNNGQIYYSLNATSGSPTWTQANNGLPARYCTRLTIGPLNPETNTRAIYATFGGFSANNVWKTTNNGATWTPISNGLPEMPVYSLVISPSNSNQLYIGTQLGVCATSNDQNGWSCTNQGPANTVVEELFWMGTTLGAATHGRSMFTATIQQ
jgi:hypothetical protein